MTRQPTTAHQARAKYGKRPKYGNKKVGGFDSVLERMHNDELEWLRELGVVTNIQKQVPFMVDGCEFILDFVYMREGKQRVDDCGKLPAGFQEMFTAAYPDMIFRKVKKK